MNHTIEEVAVSYSLVPAHFLPCLAVIANPAFSAG